MIRVDDIEEAIARHDIGTIERAFCALVDVSNGLPIEGAGKVDVLCSLLARVSRALQHDRTVMPPGLSSEISGVLASPLEAAASYAAGARGVLDHQYHWRGRYLQYALRGGKL